MTASTLFMLKRAYQATRQALEAHLQRQGFLAGDLERMSGVSREAPERVRAKRRLVNT